MNRKLRIMFFSLIAILAPFLVHAATSTEVNIRTLSDVQDTINAWVGYLVWFFWVASMVGMIYAALMFLNARGDVEKVKKAKAMVKYTIIAVVVALFSTAMRSIIVNILNGQ